MNWVIRCLGFPRLGLYLSILSDSPANIILCPPFSLVCWASPCRQPPPMSAGSCWLTTQPSNPLLFQQHSLMVKNMPHLVLCSCYNTIQSRRVSLTPWSQWKWWPQSCYYPSWKTHTGTGNLPFFQVPFLTDIATVVLFSCITIFNKDTNIVG